MKWFFVVLFLLAMLGSNGSHAAIWEITYPKASTDQDRRNDYPIKLLELALEQTGVRYVIQPSLQELPHGKAVKQLRENREINLIWSMTSDTRERELLPIRIPIYKGLIGWRVFIIHQDLQPQFYAIDSIQELANFRAIQGHDWPDTKILQANGFDVVTSSRYSELFSLLKEKQGGFFPRSVVEVGYELNSDLSGGNLMLESDLGVQYPTAIYFFLNNRSKALKRLIESGLEKVIDDGQFDQLFLQQHQELLEALNVSQRRFFTLTNPFLPEETPLSRAALWYGSTE
jgi:hypothetical protein